MNAKHCGKYKTDEKYDKDKSNRLALSPDLHGFYDGSNCEIPAVNVKVVSVSDKPVTDGRYKVSEVCCT